MARPPLDPDKKRVRKVDTRFTEAEFEEVSRRAALAGVTLSTYIRETILGRRPKEKPVRERVMNELLYELSSISTNFTQLAEATGDETFAGWSRYVGGELVERCTSRPELASLFEPHLEAINAIGHRVNRLARLANLGKELEAGEVTETLETLRQVLKPIHELVGKSNSTEG